MSKNGCLVECVGNATTKHVHIKPIPTGTTMLVEPISTGTKNYEICDTWKVGPQC